MAFIPDGLRPVLTNRLLTALPPSVYRDLHPLLEPLHLTSGQVLHEPEAPLTHSYFPVSALVSLVEVLVGGAQVDVAIIGNDSMVGLPLVLGLTAATNRARVQIPGEAFRLPLAAFQTALAHQPALRERGQRAVQALLKHMSQAAACTRQHAVEERCARWLSTIHDRVGAASFPLAQEFLANLLGVRRASAVVAAGMLQQAGLIRYRHGRITIVDGEGLEAAACECYRAIIQATDLLLPPPSGMPGPSAPLGQ